MSVQLYEFVRGLSTATGLAVATCTTCYALLAMRLRRVPTVGHGPPVVSKGCLPDSAIAEATPIVHPVVVRRG